MLLIAEAFEQLGCVGDLLCRRPRASARLGRPRVGAALAAEPQTRECSAQDCQKQSTIVVHRAFPLGNAPDERGRLTLDGASVCNSLVRIASK
jgi:hypothetical protein